MRILQKILIAGITQRNSKNLLKKMRPIKITTLFASVAQLRPKWAKNTKLREHLVHWMGNSKPLSQNRYGLWLHGSPGNLFAKWKGLTLKSIKMPRLDFCIKNILCKLLNLYNNVINNSEFFGNTSKTSEKPFT